MHSAASFCCFVCLFKKKHQTKTTKHTKQSKKPLNTSVMVKCSLFAISSVSNFINYIVFSLHWQLKSQGIAAIYFIESRIWTTLSGLMQPENLLYCFCYSPFAITLPPKGGQHSPRESLLFQSTSSVFSTISIENKHNPCLKGHEVLRLLDSEISDLKFND